MTGASSITHASASVSRWVRLCPRATLLDVGGRRAEVRDLGPRVRVLCLCSDILRVFSDQTACRYLCTEITTAASARLRLRTIADSESEKPLPVCTPLSPKRWLRNPSDSLGQGRQILCSRESDSRFAMRLWVPCGTGYGSESGLPCMLWQVRASWAGICLIVVPPPPLQGVSCSGDAAGCHEHCEWNAR